MSDTYVLAIEGLRELKSLDSLPQDIITAAKRAVNDATRFAQRQSSKEIRRQIKFPAHYLSGSNGRITIRQFASDNQLEGRIGAERRATSLARFAQGKLTTGGAKRAAGVRVEVKPGSAVRLRNAFLIKLRSGNSKTDTQFNLGLAVRTEAGQSPRRAYKPKQIGKGLWLLYGPSVDSAFINSGVKGGVATQLSPEIANYLEDQFNRQMGLLK